LESPFNSGRSSDFAAELFQPLPARYDVAAELLSFGQNGRWRRRMVDHVVGADPRLVCDVATGTAGVALQLAASSQAHVVGVDLSQEMIARGREKVMRSDASDRIRLVLGDGQRLPFADDTFDALTFTYLFRYVPDPFATLRELTRVVKPGGRIATLEFYLPPNRLWRSLWSFYTRAVLPVAGVAVGKGWYEVGRFLGPSISEHYRRFPLEAQIHEWIAAGIGDFGYEQMSLGGGIVMWGTKREG
jgi:demethylmenaquinone methyltransferase / 2-methoxy-6-polyprenyl-1,4-benzoquinol methylase